MAFSPPEVNEVALHRLLSQAFEGKENVRSVTEAKNSVTRAQMCEMLPHLREFFPAPERGEWTAEPRVAGPFAEGDRRTIEKLTNRLERDEDFLGIVIKYERFWAYAWRSYRERPPARVHVRRVRARR